MQAVINDATHWVFDQLRSDPTLRRASERYLMPALFLSERSWIVSGDPRPLGQEDTSGREVSYANQFLVQLQQRGGQALVEQLRDDATSLVWTRDFWPGSSRHVADCALVESFLGALNRARAAHTASPISDAVLPIVRMVTGHTPQSSGQICVRCAFLWGKGNPGEKSSFHPRLLNVDVGMTRSKYNYGALYLQILALPSGEMITSRAWPRAPAGYVPVRGGSAEDLAAHRDSLFFSPSLERALPGRTATIESQRELFAQSKLHEIVAPIGGLPQPRHPPHDLQYGFNLLPA